MSFSPAAVLDALGGDLDWALDELATPAWILDRDRVIRWGNRQLFEQAGEVLGRLGLDLLDPGSRATGEDDLDRLFRGHVHRSTAALTLLEPDGGRIPVAVHSVAIGPPDGIVAVFGIGAAGRPLPSRRLADPRSRLTPRELEVLRLVDRGLMTKQIAQELGLSPYTVNNYVQEINRKLRAPTRIAALSRARDLGLI
ncbi:MAG: response regulator transcription factor [Actinobacteria bacterium]|nr:response regulator transcription factor [Actinomycetota bacterium]